MGPDVTISTPDKAIFEWSFVEAQAGLTMVTVSYSSAHVMKEDMVGDGPDRLPRSATRRGAG